MSRNGGTRLKIPGRKASGRRGNLPPPGTFISSGFWLRSENYTTIRPSGTPTWLMFFTTSGEGIFRHPSGAMIAARPGDIMLYEPGVVQDYRTAPRHSWRFHWMHFYPRPAWLPWLRRPVAMQIPGLRVTRVPNLALREHIVSAFESLHRDIRIGNTMHNELALNMLERILFLSRILLPRGNPRSIDPRIQAAIERVALVPAARYTVAGIARQSNLSPSRFAHLFRQETGQSVVGFILSLRLGVAARLLEGSSLGISEVADMAGFNSGVYFSASFKKWYGLSPRGYRNYTRRHNSRGMS